MIKKITIKGEVSMSNNLRKLEKDLRAMAKRCKEIKYTRGLLLLFLLSGILSFSTLQSTEVKNVENSINQARKELNTSISSLQKTFKQVRQENNRLMKDANKELIMLMEEVCKLTVYLSVPLIKS